jgi:hypothetical protein
MLMLIGKRKVIIQVLFLFLNKTKTVYVDLSLEEKSSSYLNSSGINFINPLAQGAIKLAHKVWFKLFLFHQENCAQFYQSIFFAS